MCGIVGIFSKAQNEFDRRSYINRCLKTMHRRGPDSNGIWQSESYITGFVRLAIRDLSENGSQPMLSLCGNFCLTFNGEIYNSEKFRNQLEHRGVVFRSTTDTEVLLYSLIYYGIDVVLKEFDGMFAFSFYNLRANTLILARDRVGIKPLYIGKTPQHYIFSSQYDHIINFDSIKSEPLDSSVIGNYLQLGYVPDNAGAVQNTFMLPHGHYAEISVGKFIIKRYYQYQYSPDLHYISAESLLRKSVNEQLVSDVPVGAFLSGGVDSPLISFWANQSRGVSAFTIGNSDKVLDETENVNFYAEKFGIDSHIKTLTEKDLLATVDDNHKAYSEPFADFSSIPSLAVSKYASEHVKVVLTGDGPDELFWGYDRNVSMMYKGPLFNQSRPWLAAKYLLGKLKGSRSGISRRFFTSHSLAEFYYRSLFTFGGDHWINSIYKPKIDKPYFLEKIVQKNNHDVGSMAGIMNTVRELEMNIHLQRILLKVDRATMYHSLEARVPYLSNRVIDYSTSLSYRNCVQGNVGKMNLKKILMDQVGEDILMKPKKGFLIPMKDWLRKELKKDVVVKIMDMPSELKTYFNKKQLEKLLKDHMVEHIDYSGIIWAVYALVNWHQTHRSGN